MEQLMIIAPDFPKIGSAYQASVGDTCGKSGECGYPRRQNPPPRPSALCPSEPLRRIFPT